MRNHTTQISDTLILTALCIVTACGGGGGGGGSGQAVQPVPTSAILTLSTQGTSPGMSGLGIIIALPTSVVVRTDASGNVDNGVVTLSGVAANQATALAIYSAATSTAQATLYVLISSSTTSGLSAGEFATVRCEVQSGSPAATDFTLTGFDPRDLSANPITTLTPTFTITIH